MREGNASSLFVVWQPENFLLLSLETRALFYIDVVPGMFLLRVPVPQPGTVSSSILEGRDAAVTESICNS